MHVAFVLADQSLLVVHADALEVHPSVFGSTESHRIAFPPGLGPVYRSELIATAKDTVVLLCLHANGAAVYSLSPSLRKLIPVYSHKTVHFKPCPTSSLHAPDPPSLLPLNAVEFHAVCIALTAANTLLIVQISHEKKSDAIQVLMHERGLTCPELPDRQAIQSVTLLPSTGKLGCNVMGDMLVVVVYEEDAPVSPVLNAACLALPMTTPMPGSEGEGACCVWVLHCIEPGTQAVGTVPPGSCKGLGRSGGVLVADSRGWSVYGEEGEALSAPWPTPTNPVLAQPSPASSPRCLAHIDGAFWLVFMNDASPPRFIHLDNRTCRTLDFGQVELAPHRARYMHEHLIALCDSGPSWVVHVRLPEGAASSARRIASCTAPLHFHVEDAHASVSLQGCGADPCGTVRQGQLAAGSIAVQDSMVALEYASRCFFLGPSDPDSLTWLVALDSLPATKLLTIPRTQIRSTSHETLDLRPPSDAAFNGVLDDASTRGFDHETTTLLCRQLSHLATGPRRTFVQVTPSSIVVSSLAGDAPPTRVEVPGGEPVLHADVSDGPTPVQVLTATRSHVACWALERGPEGEFVCTPTWTLPLDAEPSCLAIVSNMPKGSTEVCFAVGFWGSNSVAIYRAGTTTATKPMLVASSHSLDAQPRYVAAFEFQASSPELPSSLAVSGSSGSVALLSLTAPTLTLRRTLTLPATTTAPQLIRIPACDAVLAVEASAFLLSPSLPNLYSSLTGPRLIAPGTASFLPISNTLTWLDRQGRVCLGVLPPPNPTLTESLHWSELGVTGTPQAAVHLRRCGLWAVLLAPSSSAGATPARPRGSVVFIDSASLTEVYRIHLRPDHHVHALTAVVTRDTEDSTQESELLVLASSHHRVETGVIDLVHAQSALSFVSIERTAVVGEAQDDLSLHLIGVIPCPLTPTALQQRPSPTFPNSTSSAAPTDPPTLDSAPIGTPSVVTESAESFFPEKAQLVVGTGHGLLLYDLATDPRGVGGVRAQKACVTAIESAWPLPHIEYIRAQADEQGPTNTAPQQPTTTQTTSSQPAAAEPFSMESAPRQRVFARLTAATSLPGCAYSTQITCISDHEIVSVDARGSVYVTRVVRGPAGGPVLVPVACSRTVISTVGSSGPPSAGSPGQSIALTATGQLASLQRNTAQETSVLRQWMRVMERAYEAGMPVGQTQVHAGSGLVPGPLYGTGEASIAAMLKKLSMEESPEPLAVAGVLVSSGDDIIFRGR